MSGLAENVAEGLLANGVRAMFGVPGSGTSYEVATELERRGVPYYGASHEGAAAIMAGAFGRQGDTVGCSMSIKGPGVANMLPGIASNHFERFATLSLSEAVGRTGAPSRVHKRLDHQAILSTLIKAYATVDDSGASLSRLLPLAREEIPGPVHLDLAATDPPVFDEPTTAPNPPAVGWTDVMAKVDRSSRPLVIVGAFARRQPWRDRLSQLRVPVFTTLSAKGVVDEGLPHVGGIFTGAGKALSPEFRMLRDADLVIGLGLRDFELIDPATIATPCVLVDDERARRGAGFPPSAVHASATPAQFEELLDRLEGEGWGAQPLAHVKEVLRERLLDHPWLPAKLFDNLAGRVPNAVLVADTGSFCTVVEHLWQASDPNDFLCSANGRYMGTGIPMAVGAALADPDRPVICATGDGGVRMYFAEIKLAIEHGLPILFLFLSDGRYGSIAAVIPPERRRPSVLAMSRPSWYEAARAIGCSAAYIEDLPALEGAVDDWLASDGPCFAEARFDPEAYVTMTADLR